LILNYFIVDRENHIYIDMSKIESGMEANFWIMVLMFLDIFVYINPITFRVVRFFWEHIKENKEFIIL
jgi:hypothetical protein